MLPLIYALSGPALESETGKSLNTLVDRKNPHPCQVCNTRPSAHGLITVLTELSWFTTLCARVSCLEDDTDFAFI